MSWRFCLPLEREQLQEQWNATRTPYPAERCVHELFEEQVERTPSALAVQFEEQTLSYSELNARANRLASYLRELGVAPDTSRWVVRRSQSRDGRGRTRDLEGGRCACAAGSELSGAALEVSLER